MNGILDRLFGDGAGSRLALGLKDLLDKLEAYLGLVAWILAGTIDLTLILRAASLADKGMAKPGPIALMAPVNQLLGSLLGLNGLVWLVLGVWVVANLLAFAKMGRTRDAKNVLKSIGLMMLMSFLAFEYGDAATLAWWMILLLIGLVVLITWLIWRRGKAGPEDARKKAHRRAIITAIILVIGCVLALIKVRGVGLIIIIPFALRCVNFRFSHI